VDPHASHQPSGQWQFGPPATDGGGKKGLKGKKGGGKGGGDVGGKGGALAAPRTPAAMLSQMALLMDQFKEEFPEREALAASIKKSVTCVRSSSDTDKDAIPLLQQHRDVQESLAKNEKYVASMDKQIQDCHDKLEKLKEQKAEAETQQVQIRARYKDLATKVRLLAADAPAKDLSAQMESFNQVLEGGDLGTIREAWANLKPACETFAAPAPAVPVAADSGGGGEGGTPGTQDDAAMPQASAEDEEAVHAFLSGEELTPEARKRVSVLLQTSTKRFRAGGSTAAAARQLALPSAGAPVAHAPGSPGAAARQESHS